MNLNIIFFNLKYKDLDRVSALKNQLQREKAAVDTRLRTDVQLQTTLLLNSLSTLTQTKPVINSVKARLAHNLTPDDSVPGFDKISKLAKVYRNFVETEKFIENFNNQEKDLAVIENWIQEGDLFKAHMGLSELWDVREKAWAYAKQAREGMEVKRVLERHFNKLDRVMAQFQKLVLENVGGSALDLVKENQGWQVVRAAKIVEVEERKDLSVEMEGTRIRQGYLEKFLDAVKQSIAALFDGCWEAFEGDSDNILDNLVWIYSDLDLVRDELVKCVPSRWNIYDKYVEYYHGELYILLNKMLAKDPNALTILKILNYVSDYYTTMAKELDIPKSQLQSPPLLDGQESKLYDEYLNLIVMKLRQWYASLASTEHISFIERGIPPDMDADKFLGLQGGEQIIFTMLSQQIDVAAESGQARILVSTIEECGSILRTRQQKWESVMQTEVAKQLADQEVPGGLVEYLIALANDQIKAADYAEALSGKTSQLVSKKYRTQVISTWDMVSDSFITLAKSCIAGLISIIFNDLTKPFSTLFVISDSSWTKGKSVKQISDTIVEYISDTRVHLNPIIFDVFMDDLLDETILKYLGGLLNESVNIGSDKAIERIKKDIEVLYVMFAQNYPSSEPAQPANPDEPQQAPPGVAHVQAQFRIFEHFLHVLECPASNLPSVFLEMRGEFWDAPLELFEAMVNARAGGKYTLSDSGTKVEVVSIIRESRKLALESSQGGWETVAGRWGKK